MFAKSCVNYVRARARERPIGVGLASGGGPEVAGLFNQPGLDTSIRLESTMPRQLNPASINPAPTAMLRAISAQVISFKQSFFEVKNNWRRKIGYVGILPSPQTSWGFK